MKLYIVGSVASGKSTLARRLSEKSGIPCYHLDDVVYQKDKSYSEGNRKRTPEERDELFQQILRTDCIIEDTGRECFACGLQLADRIVVLELPYHMRVYRIIRRHLRQVLGLEKSGYTPSLKMVRMMFKWAKNFDTGADGVKARIAPYALKTVTLHTTREVETFTENFAV